MAGRTGHECARAATGGRPAPSRPVLAACVAAAVLVPSAGPAWGAEPPVLDAARFGLVCDGATDNAAALDAISAVVEAGQVVAFPPAARPCLTSRPLLARSGVTYSARPGTVTLRSLPGSTANPALLAARGVSDVRVQGLALDGDGGAPESSASLATIYESSGVVFDNVSVANARGIGLMFSRTRGSGVRGSRLADLGLAYRATGRTADQHQAVAFCCGIEARVAADQPEPSSSVALDATAGMVPGDLVSGDGLATGTTIRALLPAGATLDRPTLLPLRAGARLVVSRNAANFATGNLFVRSGLDALSFANQTGFVADGNRCESVGGHGTGAAGACIYGASSQGVEVTGNTVRDTAGNGIDLYRVGDAAVRGNDVRRSGGSGVSFASGAGARITGNTLLDNHRNGLRPDGASQAGIFLAGGRTARTGDPAVADVTIEDNVAGDDQAAPTQTWGVQLQAGSEAHGVRIGPGNTMAGNARGALGGLE